MPNPIIKREFFYSYIPGLKQDLEGARKVFGQVQQELDIPRPKLSLKEAFMAAKIEDEFQSWSLKCARLPEEVRRELFIATYQ